MKNFLLSLGVMLCFTASFAQIAVTVNSQTNVTCFGGSDGAISVVASGGTPPYAYNWSSLPFTTSSVTNLPAGTYTVTVTDAASMTATTAAIITQPPSIVTTITSNPSSCTSPSGFIALNTAGGTTPYTYLWSNGSTAPQLGNLFPGLYWVTVVDANGCTAIDSAFISGGTTLFLNSVVTYDTCQGTACVVVFGPPNAFYSWSNGAQGQQACGLSDGTYTIFANDNFGCSAVETVTIINPAAMQVAAASTPASCGNDGAVVSTVVNGVLPYTYLWNTGDTTSQVINLPAGNYTVSITDANGCVATATTTVASGSFTLDSTSIIQATCQTASNGSATIVVSGSNPPFTYAWSNSATTNSITGLLPGTYIVTVTDNGGCFLVQTFQVGAIGLQISTTVLTPANCLTGASGSLQATVLNGDAPYSYAWSNGSTADTASGLSLGGYTVTATDANGCTAVRHQFLTTAANCYTQIGGRVYFDADTDCNYTVADLGIAGLMVKIEPGYYAYTQANGSWATTVRQGNYSVSVPNVGQAINLLNTCGIDTLPVSVIDTTTVTGLDIPKTTNTVNDIGVSLYCGTARPGFIQLNNVTIRNYGFTTADFSGSVVLDNALTAVPTFGNTAGLVIDSITYSPTTIYYSYVGLAPQQQVYFYIYVAVPVLPTVTIGQLVSHAASVNLLNNTDQNTLNNTYSCSSEIRASYDPNDKQVFNANNESIDGPATVEDTLLHYLIRFQNTGNDTAFNIVVRDTLDENLNISSFRFIAASHNVEIEFYEERIVHFVFNNILLPDSIVNEPDSHGFIEFDIEVLDKTQLLPVSNQAAIYFDFNPPIYTNTVTTQRTVGISEANLVPVHTFPNPTTGLLSVNLGGLPIVAVEMYDMMGRKVLSNEVENALQADVNASDLSNGMYIIRIQSGGVWYQDRLVVGK
jgi:uncharacterized repeat protein (TIGR01451 family)